MGDIGYSPVGKGVRNRRKRRKQSTGLARYDQDGFPEKRLFRDKIAGQLGAPIDGWVPEVIYRYAALTPEWLVVDWAIMIDVYRVEADGEVTRRRVERIDICHSEIHVHVFRQSDDPGDDQGRKTVLTSISAGDEVIVSRAYDEQLALLFADWQLRVERWIDG